jgi:phospholipid N-methyltransferase
MGYLAECRTFFREFRQQYHDTGSILPSSRFLGRALVEEMRQRREPGRILEIGPGTGPVTREILRQLRPGDQFDIVEINERFINLLRDRFANEPLFHRRREQVRLIHAPLQDVTGEAVYDVLISGLPLNNFAVPLVRDIFEAYERLLKPGGVLSYFEYALVRQLKTPFVGSEERERLRSIGELVERKIRAFQFREDLVWWNMPPAIVRHFRFRTGNTPLVRGRKVISHP